MATKAHKLFCLSLSERFQDYSDDLWGISASDARTGYTTWGGPPARGPIDGSIVPCAAGGSLAFLYDDCVQVLRTLRGFGPKAWGLYGFVDALNPLNNWYDSDVIGIDLGITMLMAENCRSGLVWESFYEESRSAHGHAKSRFQARRDCRGRSSRSAGFRYFRAVRKLKTEPRLQFHGARAKRLLCPAKV